MSHFLGAEKGNQWSDSWRDARRMRLCLRAPNSYSLQCMMESNDMHVNTQISLCSSFSGITTSPDFYIYILGVSAVGGDVHAYTLIQSEIKVCIIVALRYVFQSVFQRTAAAIFHKELLKVTQLWTTQ